jgi:hypothetical protein
MQYISLKIFLTVTFDSTLMVVFRSVGNIYELRLGSATGFLCLCPESMGLFARHRNGEGMSATGAVTTALPTSVRLTNNLVGE